MESSNVELQSLTRRVEKLERHHRILALLSAGCLTLLGVLCGLEINARRSHGPDNTIVTSQLVLKDKAGRDGARLSFDKDGQATLRFFGLNGQDAMSAALGAEEIKFNYRGSSTNLENGGLFMFDKKGEQIIGLGWPLDATPVLRMWGNDRRKMWLSAQEDGPTLGMSDDAGFESDLGEVDLITSRTGQQQKTSAAALTLFDKNRHVLWSAP
jgi:hypothetical protein